MWKAEKPSNIALIKYMGKSDLTKNKPVNSSLSWTLNHLLTKVTIEISQRSQDHWEALQTPFPFKMTDEGLEKYLKHFQNLKKYFGVKDCFKIRSGNNFPADCGLASSASSFSALTEAGCLALTELTGREISLFEKAQISSRGSGSSGRSFLNNWVYWDGCEIKNIDSSFSSLFHLVVVISDKKKEVPSSLAHEKVSSSLLFKGRSHRAEQRLSLFKENLENNNWFKLHQIAWQEFWDMHCLFETSTPGFGYFLPESLELLNKTRNLWTKEHDGPLVTMDAGPNIHFLFRSNQEEMLIGFFKNHLKNRWTCLSNHGEIGFAQI